MNNTLFNIVFIKKRCPKTQFYTLLMEHFRPKSPSNQYLRRISEWVKRPIFANSLDNSEDPILVDLAAVY